MWLMWLEVFGFKAIGVLEIDLSKSIELIPYGKGLKQQN